MIAHSGPCISGQDCEAVLQVLRSGMLCKGEICRCFESELQAYLGATMTVVVSSGKESLVLALEALGVTFGDEVILPTYVCASVEEAVRSLGATPVLCDVGTFWIMEPENVASKMSKRTKAIIIVHIFGILVNTQEFQQFGVGLVEDFCQAFGVGYRKLKYPIYGDFACFSFHATKCLTTVEGGAVAVRDEVWAERLQRVIRLRREVQSINDLQAALGLAQLSEYPSLLARRQRIAERYLKCFPQAFLTRTKMIAEHSLFFRFPLYCEGRTYTQAVTYFQRQGIVIRHGVDALLHRKNDLSDHMFVSAVDLFTRTISIPIRPSLTENEVEQIITAVNEYRS